MNIRSDYHWHKTDSARLLITIGESWTWGDSLGHTRLNDVYGRQLADMLNADWLNIAECGQSNLWIADKYCETILQIPQWRYEKVDVVLTMTEVGREFNGDRDHHRAYDKLLSGITTFDGFLDTLTELNAQQLRPYVAQYPTWIGTNFIHSNYTNLTMLDQSWIDLIVGANCQEKPWDRTLVVGSWVYERFDVALEFNPDIDRVAWRESVLNHMDRATFTTALLHASPLNHKKASKHPTAAGHKLWADYLYKNITT